MSICATKVLNWTGHLLTPVVLVTLTVLSLSPASGTLVLVPWLPFFDKIAHLVAYAVLGCCMFWSMAAHVQEGRFVAVLSRNRWQAVGVWILLVLIGAAVELVQPQFGRGAEWLDLVADGVGGILGILFANLVITWAIRIDNRRQKR